MVVSVPYEITLLSNPNAGVESRLDVSVPYEITLLSNGINVTLLDFVFQYLMKLHYSQTVRLCLWAQAKFQYLMKLHYSQTKVVAEGYARRFQYLMKLHYSQTPVR